MLDVPPSESDVIQKTFVVSVAVVDSKEFAMMEQKKRTNQPCFENQAENSPNSFVVVAVVDTAAAVADRFAFFAVGAGDRPG